MSTSGTVRYGIIGFGRFAEKTIAPAIKASPNSQLVALQKRSLEQARARAKEFGVPLAFDSVERLVSHPEACDRARVKFMVGHMLRLSPLIVRMRDLIRNGEIGSVTFARADFVYDARLSHRGWLYDRSVAGGGPIYDIGVHCLDTLRFVLDDEVVAVKSECEPWPTTAQTEAMAHMVLRFSRGVIGSIFCSFVSPVRRTFLEVVGTEGVLSATHFTASSTTVRLNIERGHNDLPEGGRVEEIQVPNLYIEEVTRFSECILNNREPFSPGLNGLMNQRVLDQAMVRA
jgi:predicted dehydrogenase